jgi:cytochrome c553
VAKSDVEEVKDLLLELWDAIDELSDADIDALEEWISEQEEETESEED